VATPGRSGARLRLALTPPMEAPEEEVAPRAWAARVAPLSVSVLTVKPNSAELQVLQELAESNIRRRMARVEVAGSVVAVAG